MHQQKHVPNHRLTRLQGPTSIKSPGERV